MERLIREKRPDGTYLLGYQGDNIHKNHWHIAPDGTVLSIKKDGDHKYNRGKVRQNIMEILPEFFRGRNAWTVGWRE